MRLIIFTGFVPGIYPETRSDPKGNPIVQEYVLPDLTKSKAGKVRHPDDIPVDTDQVLNMGNERFTVPEIIFRPNDIGILSSLVLTVDLTIFARSRSIRAP